MNVSSVEFCSNHVSGFSLLRERPGILCEVSDMAQHCWMKVSSSLRFYMEIDNCVKDLMDVLYESNTFIPISLHILYTASVIARDS